MIYFYIISLIVKNPATSFFVRISNGRMQGLYSHVEIFENFNLRITFSFVFGENAHNTSQHFLKKVGVTIQSIIQ